MALVARRVTVGNGAASRLDADPTDNVSGAGVVLIPQASGTLVLGPAGVTAANGARLPVTSGVPIAMDLGQGEAVYAIVAAGTLDVDVLLLGS